jgi:hypothetical protein
MRTPHKAVTGPPEDPLPQLTSSKRFQPPPDRPCGRTTGRDQVGMKAGITCVVDRVDRVS